jgi:hypothetical protein
MSAAGRRSLDAEVLLLLLRAKPSQDDLERISELAPAAGWSRVLAYAERHRVLPLLARGVASLPAIAFPPAVADDLRARRTAHAIQALTMCADLTAVFDLLRGSGIDALAYKGPVLSLLAQGDMTARDFVDLDLLVRPSEAAAAGRALLEKGFDGPATRPPAEEERLLRSTNERQYRRPGGSLVELHWSPAPRFFGIDLAIDDLLSRRVEVSIAGRGVPTLSAEDTVVVMAVDDGKELFPSLRPVVDMAAFLKAHPDLRWDAVIATADRAGAGRMLRVLLWLARDLQAAPLPGWIEASIDADEVAVELAAGFADRMFGSAGELGRVPVLDRRHLALQERKSHQARYLARLALTPTTEDIDIVCLPRGMGVLYLPIRVGRLGARYLLPRMGGWAPSSHGGDESD